MSAPQAGSAQPAVSVRELWKSFPRRRPVRELLRHPWRRPERIEVLKDVGLEARPGELMALLGPNGAGKTTLIKVLCGLVTPESGAVEIYGRPVAGDGRETARRVGFVHGEERSFYWRLTARENLQFYARLHGMRGAPMNKRVGELLEKVELASDMDRRFGDFSSGMRQRMAIARALIADPPLLLMDEPTRSLDPVNAAHLRGWIRDDLHRRDGKTILMATHNLREAETLCDRVAILAKGRVRAVAEPAELRRAGVSGPHYRLRIAGADEVALPVGEIVERWAVSREVTELLVRLARDEELDAVLRKLQGDGIRIVGCTAEEPDLEQVFHRLVAQAPPDPAGGPE
jgi:ABC-2 type transport system ATP-binding protein